MAFIANINYVADLRHRRDPGGQRPDEPRRRPGVRPVLAPVHDADHPDGQHRQRHPVGDRLRRARLRAARRGRGRAGRRVRRDPPGRHRAGRARARLVPLPARRAAHRGPQPRRRAGPDDRHRRADRGRQDDPRQPADALLRDRRGPHLHRRHRQPRDVTRRAALHVRDGPPGHVAVPRHDPREHRLRPRRRDRRGGHRGSPGRPRRPLRADPARRLRHGPRRRRDERVRRARSSC